MNDKLKPDDASDDPQAIRAQMRMLRRDLLQTELDSRRKAKSWVENLAAVIPILTFVAGSIGGGVAVWEYLDQRTKALAQQQAATEQDFRKPFWEKRLGAYLDMTDATTELASLAQDPHAEESKTWQDAERRFWKLYYGESVVLEDEDVAAKMVQYGQTLRDFKNGFADQRRLLESALALSRACQASVTTSWRLPLIKDDGRNELKGNSNASSK